jgi:hypothetical protein
MGRWDETPQWYYNIALGQTQVTIAELAYFIDKL